MRSTLTSIWIFLCSCSITFAHKRPYDHTHGNPGGNGNGPANGNGNGNGNVPEIDGGGISLIVASLVIAYLLYFFHKKPKEE